MKKALKDYAQGDDETSEAPVQEKSILFQLLNDSIAQTIAFCNKHNIDLGSILNENNTFKNITKFEEYADTLLQFDEWRKNFYVFDNTVSSLYEACKPEIFKQPPRHIIAVIQYLRGVIDTHIERADIDEVNQKIAELLDESIVVDNSDEFMIKEHQAEYKIVQKGKVWDLSKIDFDKLKEDFSKTKYKNIEISELRSFIEEKLHKMMEQNHTRINFAQKLQEIIDLYNSGGSSNENYFEDLLKFTKEIKEEDERHFRVYKKYLILKSLKIKLWECMI